MISDHPELVRFFASKNPGQLLFFVLPLWSFALYILERSGPSLAGLVLGVLYWTFLEYAIHRWLYHTHFKSRTLNYLLGSFHLYHHQDMGDRRVYNAGFGMIYLLTPTVLAPVLLVTRDPAFLASLTLGLTGAYYFYECVHFLLHYRAYDRGYLGYIQRYHFHHHDRAPHKNFGNTSHLWDWLLGTYDARYKNYLMPAATRKSLITEKTSEALRA